MTTKTASRRDDNLRFVAYEPDTRMLRFNEPATLAGFDDATKRAEGSLNGLELHGNRLGLVTLSPTQGGFRGPKHALAYLRSIGVT